MRAIVPMMSLEMPPVAGGIDQRRRRRQRREELPVDLTRALLEQLIHQENERDSRDEERDRAQDDHDSRRDDPTRANSLGGAANLVTHVVPGVVWLFEVHEVAHTRANARR